jgi:hypothetical protein
MRRTSWSNEIIVGKSCQQFSKVKWREVAGWSVREFSWKSTFEEKTRRLVWNGRQPGTQLVHLPVDKRIWVQEAEESASVEAVAKKRIVETEDTSLYVSVICNM